MGFAVHAPNRIDLAGGTTDIYPLCLFMDGGCTVNVSISVLSTAVVELSPDPVITLISEDQGESVRCRNPSDLPVEGPLGLIGRAVRAVSPGPGLVIRTRNHAPKGSGLGASSALLVALLRGLFQVRNQEITRRDIIDLAADIETANLGVPTGKQDYVAAAYGGVSAIEFRHGGFLRQTFSDDSLLPEALEQRLILAYTGEGHFSGMNNWEITKRYIDNTDEVRETLHRIRDVAVEMKRSLLREQWDELPRFVEREWELRRTLAPGVTTERIDRIMGAARNAGALAGKVCGAGGGGCMITMVDPDRRDAVREAMKAAGAELMPFRIDRQGLRVIAT
ncbi:MAG: hypothetical protein AB1646_01940 [Thermodesulfobacteriota bacterium]